MPNEFAEALDELIDCQEAESGEVCAAKIGNQTVAALIAENAFSDAIVSGGTTQSGSQLLIIRKSLLTSFASKPGGQPPINDTPVVVRGVKSFVLDCTEKDGIFYIMTGQPEASE